MKRALLLSLIFSIMFCSALISADLPSLPDPTHKSIQVMNTITNLGDYPDYVFVSNVLGGPCRPTVVSPTGLIQRAGGYSNYCTIVDIYAISKEDFNQTLFLSPVSSYEDYNNFFNYSKAIKVLSGIETIKTVPVTSTEDLINNNYTVDLSQIKKDPAKTDVKRNYTFYYYALIPVIALIIVALILIKRKKK